MFVYELSGCGFESRCSHLNFRFHACFEQGVPWHSGNYRVWIHSETRTWHDKNIQYSPISSLSIFRKIFEKYRYNRIYSFLCKHKLINTNKFGFRSKHWTKHVLISLIETIKNYLDDGEIVCGVFINLQKAFDTVNHEALLES